MGDITSDLGRANNTATVEIRKRKKKKGRDCTDENMNSLGSTRAKRLCEEDCSGLPRKKRVVSPYDQFTLSSMVEAAEQPCQQQ